MKAFNESRREFLRVAAKLSVAGVAAPFALNLAGINAAAAESASDYRALVCVFLYGGNDHNNTLLPLDAASYATYAAIRQAIARPTRDIVALEPKNALQGTNAGRQFGLPKELLPLKRYWDEGKLAVLANVGPLIVPTSKTQYLNNQVPLPPKLFSHNDQQSIWQANAPEGAKYGWGGRLGDLFAAQNARTIFTCNSVAGNSVFLAGQTVSPFQLTSSGSITINALKGSLFGSTMGANALKALITAGGAHVFTQDLANITQRSIDADSSLSTAFLNTADIPLPEALSGNSLAEQLHIVARTISVRDLLGAKRQVFFVALNGFDTHDEQVVNQAELHAKMASAMAYFYSTLESLRLSEQVTTFTASDFGRTLASNGDGSDHGWGAHHFILGGAVEGRQYFGTFPIMGIDTNDDVGAGRLLPTTSVDQYAATLASWFGVSDSDLRLVLPNIGNFDSRTLGFMRS